MHYLVGDLQGCCDALERLLAEIGFSPSRDRLTVLGDLVNRGPASLATLERLAGFGDAADCLLGNHDLHLLAVAHGVRPAHRSDTFDDVLASPRRAAWIDWLRTRRGLLDAVVFSGGEPTLDPALPAALDAVRDFHLARIRYEAAIGKHAPATPAPKPAR